MRVAFVVTGTVHENVTVVLALVRTMKEALLAERLFKELPWVEGVIIHGILEDLAPPEF